MIYRERNVAWDRTPTQVALILMSTSQWRYSSVFMSCFPSARRNLPDSACASMMCSRTVQRNGPSCLH